MKQAKVSNYFAKSQGFESLPRAYQKKIINFFSEDRHYMVDMSDVRFLLASGQNFITFESCKDLPSLCRNNQVVGLIACKKCNWPSMDAFVHWEEKVVKIVGDKTELVFLTHVFQFESDSFEEWYIASVNLYSKLDP